MDCLIVVWLEKLVSDQCNIVWREVKEWMNDEEKEKKLVEELKKNYNQS